MAKRKISVAFQGGGAKLIGLIAAAEAISQLNNVEIRAVSGSSAGSIAALLLAAKADFTLVKKSIRKHRDKIDDRFYPISGPSMFMKAVNFGMFGSPVYGAKHFNDIMQNILSDAGINIFGDIEKLPGPKLHINISDCYEGRTVSIESGNIRDALRKSCCIPFIFSTHKSEDQGQFIDGGVFDNLPTDILLNNATDEEKVFAVGFKPDNIVAAKTSFDYIMRLISSVISHKVAKSYEKVGEENVYQVETAIRLLDFDKIVSIGLDEEYDTIKSGTAAFFGSRLVNGFETNSETVKSRKTIARLTEMEKGLITTIEDVFKGISGSYSYVRMTVNANSITDEDVPDDIWLEQFLRIPEKSTIPGTILPLLNGSGSHFSTDCIVKFDGPDGENIPFNSFTVNDEIIRDEVKISRNSVIILFKIDLTLLFGRSVYIQKHDKRYGFMRPLVSGRDDLGLRASYWGSDELYLQLNYPRSLGRVSSDWSAKGSMKPCEEVTFKDTGGIWLSTACRLERVPKDGHLKGVFTVGS